ncbi:hypothetical protein KAX97_09610 [candidate division WOR-3 bacterium]|nr:hypothetical protein [candidate division WOR-3 bacterium]
MELRIYDEENKCYRFKPKEDITAYEVSLLLGSLIADRVVKRHNAVSVPKEIKRHFVEEG